MDKWSNKWSTISRERSSLNYVFSPSLGGSEAELCVHMGDLPKVAYVFTCINFCEPFYFGSRS
jgi:hypothetical protein